MAIYLYCRSILKCITSPVFSSLYMNIKNNCWHYTSLFSMKYNIFFNYNRINWQRNLATLLNTIVVICYSLYMYLYIIACFDVESVDENILLQFVEWIFLTKEALMLWKWEVKRCKHKNAVEPLFHLLYMIKTTLYERQRQLIDPKHLVFSYNV